MNTCYVLGLGKSLSEYKPQENDICFGVNDIWQYHKTEYVVCLEKPTVQRSITPEKLQVLKECKPSIFYTNESGWEKYHKLRVNKIKLDRTIRLKPDVVPCSNNSPFVAVALAARHGFNNIVLYGVDFLDHWQLSAPKIKSKIINDYQKLNEELLKKNITLYVGSQKSILHKILPLWKK